MRPQSQAHRVHAIAAAPPRVAQSLAPAAALAATSIITRYAGTGVAGFSGDGGPATQAQLGRLYAVAMDRAGDLYFTEDKRIREVIASTGVITTVAGNGLCCYGGDGGPATKARLNLDFGIAVDGAGNLYIGDELNNRVRKVNHRTGIITTVAGTGFTGYSGDGGPATQATLNEPSGVAVDRAGNLFIADSGNQVVREVLATSRTIVTYAGTGTPGSSGDGGPATQARLFFPVPLAVDRAGNLFIGDSGNNRIRKVLASTGVIVAVAGNGSPRLRIALHDRRL